MNLAQRGLEPSSTIEAANKIYFYAYTSIAANELYVGIPDVEHQIVETPSLYCVK